MKYMYRKSISVMFLEDSILFYDNSNEKKYKISNLDEKSKHVFMMINKGYDSEKIIEEVDEHLYVEAINFLNKNDLIIHKFPNIYMNTKFEKQIEYYSEYFKEPQNIPEILKQKKVLIIGLGGVGCIAIQHLIAAGIEEYICIDNDVVQASNLNRQFCYTNNDIGKLKTDVIKEYIHYMNPNATVSCYNEFVESSINLKRILSKEGKIDFILVCADIPHILIKNIVIEYAIEKGIPLSFIGIGVNDGIWGPLISEKKIWKNFTISIIRF